ncbi:phage late control D family protein [Chromobacterium alkanivorans]|uniref:phage late control D family protein n=1 Tax=Chromobacterium alkanivorans TaxID=1071719 RepID=UPI00196773C6|nr:phage late control D family protein [Chromobacterium alkanivorans]MBN3005597.1 phage late control D family protein [Chromobacterium alkanivorans]
MSGFLDDVVSTGTSAYNAAAGGVSQLADGLAGALGLSALQAPAYQISVNGKNITSRLQGRLICLTLTDNKGFEADQLDLELDDADGKLEIPPRGAKLQLAIGWKGKPLVDKGTYIVDEIEHRGAPDRLTLRARATDLRAGLTTKKERSWHKTTIGKVVEAIAKANGLKPAIPAWLAKKPVDHIDQTNESDANLLTRLAHQYDAVATVKNGRLIFCKAGEAESVTGKPFPTALVKRSSGDQHHFSAADRDAYTAVKACWHNLDRGTQGEVIVDANTKFERRSRVGKRGRPTKRKHLTAVQQKAIEPSAANIKVLRHIYASEATALQGAKAAWEKLQRGVAEFSIVLATGRPELFPELPAKVQGFKPIIDACGWIISKVTHTLNDSGYTTALEFEMKLEDLKD